jgi:hypothetical protein
VEVNFPATKFVSDGVNGGWVYLMAKSICCFGNGVSRGQVCVDKVVLRMLMDEETT